MIKAYRIYETNLVRGDTIILLKEKFFIIIWGSNTSHPIIQECEIINGTLFELSEEESSRFPLPPLINPDHSGLVCRVYKFILNNKADSSFDEIDPKQLLTFPLENIRQFVKDHYEK